MIKQVTIVGGTHGNEFTGVYLVKKWKQQSALIKRESFSTDILLANVKAYDKNCRYVDCDLNRQFKLADLENETFCGEEHLRAKQINEQLGPKGNAKTDFIIDLHTTTTNMGPNVILPEKGPFYSQLAAYVKMQMPEAVIFCDDNYDSAIEHHFLSTIAKRSVLVEVGPVPQGVLRQDVFEQSEQLTHILLDFIDFHNQHKLPTLPKTVTAYRFVESVKLPLDDQGQRRAMIHKHVQDNDFKPLHPGDPIFRTFDGEDILYQGKTVVYPAFVNEAAYYDNNLAMSLMQQVELTV
ncbi:MAG: aspartoacylase [Algicola sp.]|nr:aspartoacylase [Algicola sp.]